MTIEQLFDAQPGAAVSVAGSERRWPGTGRRWRRCRKRRSTRCAGTPPASICSRAPISTRSRCSKCSIRRSPSRRRADRRAARASVRTARRLLDAHREFMPGRHPKPCGRRSQPTAFRMPRAPRRASRPTAAWMYRFTWETPVFGGVLWSTHALEIPFVFDTLDQPGADQFTGDGLERAAIADACTGPGSRFAPATRAAGPEPTRGPRCASTGDSAARRPGRRGAGPGTASGLTLEATSTLLTLEGVGSPADG